MRISGLSLVMLACIYFAAGENCDHCDGDCCPESPFSEGETCCQSSEQCISRNGQGVCVPRKLAAFWMPFIAFWLIKKFTAPKHQSISNQNPFLNDRLESRLNDPERYFFAE